MNIGMTTFALKHFEGAKAGTQITSHSANEFLAGVNYGECRAVGMVLATIIRSS